MNIAKTNPVMPTPVAPPAMKSAPPIAVVDHDGHSVPSCAMSRVGCDYDLDWSPVAPPASPATEPIVVDHDGIPIPSCYMSRLGCKQQSPWKSTSPVTQP